MATDKGLSAVVTSLRILRLSFLMYRLEELKPPLSISRKHNFKTTASSERERWDASTEEGCRGTCNVFTLFWSLVWGGFLGDYYYCLL